MSSNLASSYTASDAERAGKKPDAFREDDPPSLRFEHGTAEDRQESMKQGRTVYVPTIEVHIRAHGDIKCEVPYIAEGWAFETREIEKEVQRPVYRTVEKNGEWVEEQVMITDTVQEAYQFRVATTPWGDQLKERLHHKRISQSYYDYCMSALARFKEGSEMPVEGTPIVGWNQINMAMQKNAVDLGINTIELAAEMTDEAMDALGMGARDVKKKAIAYISASDGQISGAKLVALESENERTRAQNDTLAAKIADLEQRIQDGEKPKRRGRPPKAPEPEVSESA